MHFIIRRWEYYYRNLVSYSNTPFKSKMSYEVGDKSCMTMEMYNLAEPRWIKIDCNKTIRTAVVCMKEQIFENQSISTILRGARSQTSTLGLYLLYFNFSLRTKNKLGCPSFLDFVFGIGSNRYSG